MLLVVNTSNALSQSAGFSLYPNPVFEIEITSTNGQSIYKGMHSSGDELSTQKWQTGIYLIKIISGDKSYVTRIVKE